MMRQVLFEQAQSGSELGQGNAKRLHMAKSSRGRACYASIAVSMTDCLAAESWTASEVTCSAKWQAT